VGREKLYSDGFFEKLIAALDLPMRIETYDDRSLLRATGDKTVRGDNGAHVTGFFCEIEPNPENAQRLIREMLNLFFSRVFSSEWSTTAFSPISPREEFFAAYEATVRAGLPATERRIDVWMRVDDIDQLQEASTWGDALEVYVPLAKVRLSSASCDLFAFAEDRPLRLRADFKKKPTEATLAELSQIVGHNFGKLREFSEH
jgi:hypothetical protein